MRHRKNIGVPLMNLLKLKGVHILQQLHLKERLLRPSSDNWCIINDGTTHIPTIVMGVLGKRSKQVISFKQRMGELRGGDVIGTRQGHIPTTLALVIVVRRMGIFVVAGDYKPHSQKRCSFSRRLEKNVIDTGRPRDVITVNSHPYLFPTA
ncbi:hypothetical protein LguiA_011120 [Lonicera macranthoides]